MTVTKTAKIAISLPSELLGIIEKERKITGESRSEYLRRAVVTFLGREEGDEIADAYARAFMKEPETAGEIEAARRASRSLLAQEPWR
ncbi:MAG: ribbon-helix-helix protein, CopG family [Chloroflexi bacterium]|nr:ribbon-helix-helix protein, CopG family [Chloroflexota bacterium]